MAEKQHKIFGLVILFVLGTAGVLFILPSLAARLIFLGFALVVLFWTTRARQKLDINTLSLVVAYVLAVAQFGIQFYFQLPAWLITIITFFWVSLTFWLGFKLKIGNITASAKILSLTAGLVAAEVALALLFWPTHFLVTSTVFFLLYYVAWMTSQFYMSGLLNFHRVLIHVIYAGVILLIVLITAQWTI